MENKELVVKVFSFSYKKGIPADESGNGGGYAFDCRAVHNPGRYEEYKQLTGRDKPVIDFLEKDGEILTFLNSVWALVDFHVARYMERGFTSLMEVSVVQEDSTVQSTQHRRQQSTSLKNSEWK